MHAAVIMHVSVIMQPPVDNENDQEGELANLSS
jgi:hypothetical protein